MALRRLEGQLAFYICDHEINMSQYYLQIEVTLLTTPSVFELQAYAVRNKYLLSP